MGPRKHFVPAALAVALSLVDMVFHMQVFGPGREILDTDDYAEGEEEAEKRCWYEPAPF